MRSIILHSTRDKVASAEFHWKADNKAKHQKRQDFLPIAQQAKTVAGSCLISPAIASIPCNQSARGFGRRHPRPAVASHSCTAVREPAVGFSAGRLPCSPTALWIWAICPQLIFISEGRPLQRYITPPPQSNAPFGLMDSRLDRDGAAGRPAVGLRRAAAAF